MPMEIQATLYNQSKSGHFCDMKQLWHSSGKWDFTGRWYCKTVNEITEIYYEVTYKGYEYKTKTRPTWWGLSSEKYGVYVLKDMTEFFHEDRFSWEDISEIFECQKTV